MAKRVIQHATSGSRRSRRVAKPSVPWRRGLPVDAGKEAVMEANPNTRPRRVKKGPRFEQLKSEGNYVEPKLPKGANKNADGTFGPGKDTAWLVLPEERGLARDYEMQERSEQHRRASERKQTAAVAAAGYELVESTVDYGDEQ